MLHKIIMPFKDRIEEVYEYYLEHTNKETIGGFGIDIWGELAGLAHIFLPKILGSKCLHCQSIML